MGDVGLQLDRMIDENPAAKRILRGSHEKADLQETRKMVYALEEAEKVDKLI